jgi:hypothetical protein
MNNQTHENDVDNRYKTKKKDLPQEIRLLWLEQEDAKITVELNDTECDVQEIRELLDEDKYDNSKALRPTY